MPYTVFVNPFSLTYWLLFLLTIEPRSYPQPQPRCLQVGSKVTRPSNIPSHLPSLPDPHTYIKTPVSLVYYLLGNCSFVPTTFLPTGVCFIGTYFVVRLATSYFIWLLRRLFGYFIVPWGLLHGSLYVLFAQTFSTPSSDYKTVREKLAVEKRNSRKALSTLLSKTRPSKPIAGSVDPSGLYTGITYVIRTRSNIWKMTILLPQSFLSLSYEKWSINTCIPLILYFTCLCSGREPHSNITSVPASPNASPR